MVHVMHNVLLDVTKATFAYATYIGISIYEVTTINNIQWLSMHLYEHCLGLEKDSNPFLC
jgi:hypothetical protein